MKPPAAKRIPKQVGAHGEQRTDNYHWLRDRSDDAVLEYLEAENEYTTAMMKHTEILQQNLYRELIGRIKETDTSVPEIKDEYHYYTRTKKGKQYEIHCRKKGSLGGEEVMLDENPLAEGHNYFSVGVLKVSPDHKLLAYSVDVDGSESYTLYVKNLETGDLLKEVVPNTYYGVEWANDNETLFYNTLDDAKRPHKLFRHKLGTAVDRDTLVFHEEDDAFFLEIGKTKSKRYIVLDLGSNTTKEVHYLDANHPAGHFKVVHPRQHEMEYSIFHHGDHFYILTNDDAKNFKLMKVAVADPVKSNWTEVIPHRKDVKIDNVEVFKNHLVVFERENGLKKIHIMDLDTGGNYYVEFPEEVYTFWPAENEEFNTEVLRFNFSSLVTPRTVIDYNMSTRKRVVKKRYEVLGGYDVEGYVTERIFATATDGTNIPISIVYKKGMVRNGGNRVLLYGYGAYGSSIEPNFVSSRLSLLDRGFIYAIAHVRGGGELGRQWYEQGKLLNKRKTFTDFIACAEQLVQKRYTSAGNIVVSGGSAGGLLVGAVVNMRPDLFRAAVVHVPFVDVLSTMLDEKVPLTVIEYEEWGDPNDKKYYEYIRSYSPYDTVKAQDYPHMLIVSGLNDPRVQYWEPAKWTAKLRALKTDDNLLLLKMNMNEGHSGASGRYDYLRDLAFEYTFLFECFGITE